MKKLILLRHAKSSWKDPELDDHERPLNGRGRRAAPAIGGWLAGHGHRPDRVLCSSARRARETCEGVAGALPGLPEPEIDRRLYHATPDALRERLREIAEPSPTAMLIGHQPGIGALTRKLAGGKVRPGCRRAFEHFPTAAAAVLEFDIEAWRDLCYGMGRFVDFAVPREVMTS